MLKKIVEEVVKKYRARRLPTNASGIFRRINWYNRPRYVWVFLYKNDGPLRWVVRGEWAMKNLIMIAERTYARGAAPILVKNPHEVWKEMRLQYGPDIIAATKPHAT